MLLLVAYSQAARGSLRNVCRRHEDCVVRQFGRAALLEETEFGAFQAVRLRERHGPEIQVERTRPFNEFETVDEGVRAAAAAYENREEAATPYARFAAGTDHPSQDAMKDAEL